MNSTHLVNTFDQKISVEHSNGMASIVEWFYQKGVREIETRNYKLILIRKQIYIKSTKEDDWIIFLLWKIPHLGILRTAVNKCKPEWSGKMFELERIDGQ